MIFAKSFPNCDRKTVLAQPSCVQVTDPQHTQQLRKVPGTYSLAQLTMLNLKRIPEGEQ
jgi:hypothetical protein